LTSIILAMTGVLLMVGNSLTPGELSGNLAAFTMPITFAILIMIVRKFPSVIWFLHSFMLEYVLA